MTRRALGLVDHIRHLIKRHGQVTLQANATHAVAVNFNNVLVVDTGALMQAVDILGDEPLPLG